MRAFKKEESAQKIFDVFRAYYNFIKPHPGLQGKTPAEIANINLNLKGNKWLEFIRQAKTSDCNNKKNTNPQNATQH